MCNQVVYLIRQCGIDKQNHENNYFIAIVLLDEVHVMAVEIKCNWSTMQSVLITHEYTNNIVPDKHSNAVKLNMNFALTS